MELAAEFAVRFAEDSTLGYRRSWPATLPRKIRARRHSAYGGCRDPDDTMGQRAPVAQLDRATDFESVGREFESLRAHQFRPPLHEFKEKQA